MKDGILPGCHFFLPRASEAPLGLPHAPVHGNTTGLNTSLLCIFRYCCIWIERRKGETYDESYSSCFIVDMGVIR